MTLIVYHKNALVCDRMVALGEPHSYIQKQNIVKLFVSPNKTFAFGIAGDTFSPQLLSVMGAAIEQSFQMVGKEAETIQVPHFNIESLTQSSISMILITRKSVYALTEGGLLKNPQEPMRPTRNTRPSRRSGIDAPARYALRQLSPVAPVGYGTGIYSAGIALLEGVAMKNITKFVSVQEVTVSAECDMITQRELKAWKL